MSCPCGTNQRGAHEGNGEQDPHHPESRESAHIFDDFWTLAYQAIDD